MHKRAAHRVVTTDKQIREAIARANEFARHDRLARAVKYDRGSDRVVIEMGDGVIVSIPRTQLEGLEDAARGNLSKIELLGGGSGLHWPELNVDHYVPGILNGIFGTKKWMAELGRLGGSATSAAKAAAARRNGKKGGRPKATAA
ncbi:MAG TPA: DUF2442 domain-containing protein [Terriglobales bacterium]